MPLTKCPECNRDISDQALMCPNCGWSAGSKRLFGYEYRSKTSLFGLPLVHIASGFDPLSSRRRVARGIIAIGDQAVGFVAIGGLALGFIALGGGAIGILALGGGAVGLLFAFGGAAVGGIALGGGAYGVHPLGANFQDPLAADFFRGWLGSWVDLFVRIP